MCRRAAPRTPPTNAAAVPAGSKRNRPSGRRRAGRRGSRLDSPVLDRSAPQHRLDALGVQVQVDRERTVRRKLGKAVRDHGSAIHPSDGAAADVGRPGGRLSASSRSWRRRVSPGHEPGPATLLIASSTNHLPLARRPPARLDKRCWRRRRWWSPHLRPRPTYRRPTQVPVIRVRLARSSTDVGGPCWAPVTMRTDGLAVDAAGREGLERVVDVDPRGVHAEVGVSRFHHRGQPSTSPPASPSPTRPVAPRPRTPQCRLRALISAPADDRSLGER
jgi:hypothetical protein